MTARRHLLKKLHVAQLSSNSPEYTRAFQTFLAHTDQKEKTMEWLEREIAGLTRRDHAIDAGAGTGKLTAWLTQRFAAVTALEPNPSLAAELRAACPGATLLPDTIAAASPGASADLVVCSHVFYYIPRAAWERTIRQLMSWTADDGVLAIVLQNPHTDCMKMVNYFSARRYELGELEAVAEAALGGSCEVRLDTVEATIQTEYFPTACEIAEFMLNVLPIPNPPLWVELEEYVSGRFRRFPGRYEFSCHQDILRIARRR